MSRQEKSSRSSRWPGDMECFFDKPISFEIIHRASPMGLSYDRGRVSRLNWVLILYQVYHCSRYDHLLDWSDDLRSVLMIFAVEMKRILSWRVLLHFFRRFHPSSPFDCSEEWRNKFSPSFSLVPGIKEHIRDRLSIPMWSQRQTQDHQNAYSNHAVWVCSHWKTTSR